MKANIVLVVLALLLVLALAEEQTITIIDEYDRVVEVPQNPQRIICIGLCHL